MTVSPSSYALSFNWAASGTKQMMLGPNVLAMPLNTTSLMPVGGWYPLTSTANGPQVYVNVYRTATTLEAVFTEWKTSTVPTAAAKTVPANYFKYDWSNQGLHQLKMTSLIGTQTTIATYFGTQAPAQANTTGINSPSSSNIMPPLPLNGVGPWQIRHTLTPLPGGSAVTITPSWASFIPYL